MAEQRFSAPPDPTKTAATERTSQRAKRAIKHSRSFLVQLWPMVQDREHKKDPPVKPDLRMQGKAALRLSFGLAPEDLA
jgi:hypothetical protein